jgi:bifunctional ADP-heptose synthase (sugar kinase/adenylyltransferase)
MRTAASKIGTPDSVANAIAGARADGRSLAMATGSFAILHAAWVDHLAAARRSADLLVVVVNEGGPHAAGAGAVSTEDRALVVAALRDVDHVIVAATEATPALLRRLRPDVFYPGSAPDEDALEALRSCGGRIADSGDPEGETLRLVERLRR